MAALLVVLLAAAGGLALAHLRVDDDVAALLPKGRDPTLAALAEALAHGGATRTRVLTVGGPSEVRVAEAGSALAARLRGAPGVARVESGGDPRIAQSVRSLYFPRRLYFVSDRPRVELATRLEDAGLRTEARRLRARLAEPDSSLVRRLAPADPLLSFLAQLGRIEHARKGALRLSHGQLVTRDGRFAVLFVTSRASAFDASAQRALGARIERAFRAVRRARGGRLSLEQSGVGRFTVAAEHSIRSDITRISLVSMVAIVLLFLVLFRSLRSLVLAFVPIASGLLAGLAACVAVFGSVHGITLAFGATLIGVCIDYSVHLLDQHALGPSDATPAQALGRTWPGIALGGVTTVAGLSGLGATSFAGMRQIAVFGAAGVVAALVATRFVLPAFMPKRPRPTAVQRRLADGLGALVDRLRRRRWMVVAPGFVALAVAVAGIPKVRWVDDPAALAPADPALAAEDARVRARVGAPGAGSLVVAFGADDEQALERNDAVALALEQARAAGEVGAFRSLHALLWSARLQRENVATLKAAHDLPARLDAAFVAEGFRPGSFAPFAAALDHAPPSLRWSDVSGSALGGMVRPFRLRVGSRVALLTFTNRVKKAAALRRRLAPIPGVRLFDPHAFVAAAYKGYRTRTMELVGAGLFVVLALVALWYRRLRLAVAALAPAVLAAGATLGLLGLLGTRANLLHLVGVLLVLSMGADYGVFMVEHRDWPEGLAATLLSVLIACLTTVLSFGLLALTDNPALHALGTTVAVGVLASLVLAPTTWLLLGGEALPPRAPSTARARSGLPPSSRPRP